jgi:hypothetical protein
MLIGYFCLDSVYCCNCPIENVLKRISRNRHGKRLHLRLDILHVTTEIKPILQVPEKKNPLRKEQNEFAS